MIDTSNVKPGDRVRVTAENGDTAEFTVTQTNSSGGMESTRNYFARDEWSTLEILSPPKPTLTEQYLALAPGTRFGFTNTTVEYTKLDDRHFAMHYDRPHAPQVRDWNDYKRVSGADIRVVGA